MADDEALFQKGMPIRREVLGAEYVDASMARADDFMMSFQRATTAWAWGWAWGDATIDRKTRSLMNLAMLTALNRAREIKLHVKGALNIPHSEMTASRMAEYPNDKVFVVYCAGPHCDGANKAALRLARLGLPVKMMIGGVTGWIDEGFTLTQS